MIFASRGASSLSRTSAELVVGLAEKGFCESIGGRPWSTASLSAGMLRATLYLIIIDYVMVQFGSAHRSFLFLVQLPRNVNSFPTFRAASLHSSPLAC